MSKTYPPELKKYLDKQMVFKLNGNRKRNPSWLRPIHEHDGDRQIGMVVIRGNSIVIMEPRERIS
ncbi:Small nuclear ribonucleoprotein G [Aphelenchoides bicaudatus]|nr:Small nuclear ribonucleoprotein G [Aphelenchoides bicaudatus]